MALPQYTSDIIDVGIINSGTEYILPEAVTAQTYEGIQMIMTEDEREDWIDSFEKQGEYYVAKPLSDEELEALDHKLLIPAALAYQMSNYQGEIPADVAQLQSGNVADMTAMLMQARQSVEQTIDTVGETTVRSMALQFTAQCHKDAGLDVGQIQINYLLKAGIKMLLITLLMGIAAISVGFFASRVGAGIGLNLRKKVFSKVIRFSNAEIDKFSTASLITRSTNDIQQVQMVSTMLLRMVLFAPIIGVGGIIKVINTGAGMGWIIALSVILIMGFVLTLVSITMPKFKMMQTLMDRVNLVSREILTGLNVIRAFGREEKKKNDLTKQTVI